MEYQIKDIPGFEGKYQATTTGEIFSVISNKNLRQYDDTYGYNTCNLEGKTYKIHKLIGMTFLENPNSHIQIDHINRNRKDNNVSNLRYVSSSENQINKTSYARKPSELRNIQVKKSTFKVTINTKDKPTIHKSFKTLEEAQTFRDIQLTLKQNNPNQITLKQTPEQPVAL